MSEAEQAVCETLLDRAQVMIDAAAPDAGEDVKSVVSCMMTQRALSNGTSDLPMGATQGSRSGLGYSESWTMSSGSVGELYLSKTEKKMLGISNSMDSQTAPPENMAI